MGVGVFPARNIGNRSAAPSVRHRGNWGNVGRSGRR